MSPYCPAALAGLAHHASTAVSSSAFVVKDAAGTEGGWGGEGGEGGAGGEDGEDGGGAGGIGGVR